MFIHFMSLHGIHSFLHIPLMLAVFRLRSISYFFRSQQWSEKVHTVELKIAQPENVRKFRAPVEELVQR